MDPQTRFQALTWSIAFIGGFGMLVIVVLAAMWRRHLKREQRLERERAERLDNAGLHIDTWQAAGERMQPPPPEDGEHADDEDPGDGTWDSDPDDDDDDRDEKEEPPWR